MSNEGFFELGLIDVSGRPAHDAKTTVKFIRGTENKTLAVAHDLQFPPSRRFKLPAFPQEQNLICDVSPERWRPRNSGFFTLTDGETIIRNLTVLRKPGAWQPHFDAWNDLPVHFLPLKRALDRSPNLKVRKGEALGKFIDVVYNGVTSPKTILAKTGLLNLYTKMTQMAEPVSNSAPWFSFVEEILEIAQSRMIALVRAEMGQLVRAIRDNIDDFPEYERAIASNHFENMPPQFGVKKSSMFSVKSADDKGNLQLTLGQGKDAGGNDVLVLDADIDESGKLLEHVLDVFKHKITGKQTHPHDIHEYLKLAHPGVPLGYELV